MEEPHLTSKMQIRRIRGLLVFFDAQKFIKIIIIKTSNVILCLKAKKDNHLRDFFFLMHFWGDYNNMATGIHTKCSTKGRSGGINNEGKCNRGEADIGKEYDGQPE